MKHLKYIISLVLLFTLFSCDQDAIRPYIDGKNIGTVGAAFSSSVLSYNLSSEDKNVIKVLVYRGNTKNAASVPVSITSPSPIFTLASNAVNFEAGSGSAYLSVNYTMASVLPATLYKFTLKLTDSTTLSPSKAKIMSVTAQLPLKYASLGTGRYVSEFYETDASVSILKADLPSTLPSYYRIVEPYEKGYNIDFSVDNGVIKIASQNIGWKYSDAYGFVYVTPKSTSVNGKTYSWLSQFTLPTAGMAFGGTYTESCTLP